MKEYYRVQANINLDAIYDNVANARKLLSEDTKMMAIITSDILNWEIVSILCSNRYRNQFGWP